MKGLIRSKTSRALLGGRVGGGAVLTAAAAIALSGGPMALGASSPVPPPTPPAASANWVGVGELLVVKLSPTGTVSASPYQHTEVTASSDGTVQTEVPMSASGMRKLAGSQPTVKNGVGQFRFTQDGTSTQNVRSDFTGKIPLTVKVAYELNGQPIQASALAPTKHGLKKNYKSGTLKVTYTISNVTIEKTTVSFEGFNGAQVTKTIADPIPMVAEVKVTFPKDGTAINAPGASLATGKTGVKATWDALLAPPLSGASKTISYSLHLNQAKAADATIEAEALESPVAPTGKVPQAVAGTLASVEGQPEGGLGGSPESLGQVRSDNSRPQKSASSKLHSQKASLVQAHKTTSNAAVGMVKPDLDQLAITQTNEGQTAVAQTEATLSDLNGNASSQVSGLRDVGDAQLNGLRAPTNQVIASLASEVATGSAKAGVSVGTVLTDQMTALASSITSLGTSVSAHAAGQLSATAAVAALETSATSLGTVANDLVTVTAQHAADAAALDQLITQLTADANALPAEARGTPTWTQLAKDLATAKVEADLMSSAAADIAQRASAMDASIQNVQRETLHLADDVKGLASAAAGIHTSLADDVLTAERNLASAVTHATGKLGSFQAQIAAAQSTIDRKIKGAQDELDVKANAAKDQMAQTTTAVQTKVHSGGLKARADLAAAEQKVESTVQHAVGSVQSTLDKANADYAQLLALTQIAEAHQLPGGNAKSANVQNSGYVFRISGTG